MNHPTETRDRIDEVPALLAAFETEDAEQHLRTARRIAEIAARAELPVEGLRGLVGPWLENIECLLVQDLRNYEAMFLGRDPVTGELMEDTDRWMWRHEGQMSSQAKTRLRLLVDALPEAPEVCEVGSFIGRGSTRTFIEALRSSGRRARMFCVDPWPRDVLMGAFEANLRQFGAEDFVTPIRKSSTEASLDFEDDRFDLVYLDGAHDYHSVMSDLCNWYPKVKPGGILAGDDCAGCPSASSITSSNGATSMPIPSCWSTRTASSTPAATRA